MLLLFGLQPAEPRTHVTLNDHHSNISDRVSGGGAARQEATVNYAPVLKVFPKIVANHELFSIFYRVFKALKKGGEHQYRTDEELFEMAAMRVYPMMMSHEVDAVAHSAEDKEAVKIAKKKAEKKKMNKKGKRMEGRDNDAIIKSEAKYAAGEIHE